MSDTATQRADVLDRLERARQRVEDVEARIDEHGETAVEEAAAAYDRARALLDSYVDRATGTGRENFKAYVQLEGEFNALVEDLPEDLSRRDAFEDALEAIDKRRLSEEDFEQASEALGPAETFADLLAEREETQRALEDARNAATSRLNELEAEISHREDLLELSDVDLEAPVDRLREPIERYNDAIEEAFVEYRRTESAREMFAILDRSRWYPLVDFEQPPDDLQTYVTENEAGEYTIPQLLEYADYSRSKLDHYVDDADELKRRVATQRTYLDGIDADPLTLDWPPRPPVEYRYQIRERLPFVDRIGTDDVVQALRTVRALTFEDEYERLQSAAVATEGLSDDDRKRLANNRVQEELAELREKRDRIRTSLEEGNWG